MTQVTFHPKLLEIVDSLEKRDMISFNQAYTEFMATKQTLLLPNIMPTIEKNYMGITGLYFIKDFLSVDQINNIKHILDTDIDFEPLNKANSKSRKIAHYGYYYSYDRSGLKPATAIPKNILEYVKYKYINNLAGSNLLDKDFDQLIINKYKPGEQIAPHIDLPSQFGAVIACLSIGQEVDINFSLGLLNKNVKVTEGSLYIMSGDARYKWKHALRNKGMADRYSLTFRSVIL